MREVRLYTIGFTKKTAEEFFASLRGAHVKRLIDVRLNNMSQLAGFSKRDDLAFFLRDICQCDYRHEPALAPTEAILDAYKKKAMDWTEYEARFSALLRQRQPEDHIDLATLDQACLLCSEPEADKCHRRLVAEYFRSKLGHIQIVHL
ncbi:DUF488 domain-containing protein [Anaerobaca lacustris]|uniref:DUF488 domain-containing protein n=1 Tax=Anaerobaca lacustris TaxID=3044600 RepID=A0AAW6U2J4_9BACT|nr:DUF488 domain-containing protein [Sedimentisphaerales bacterium M17dextr]